MKRKLLHIIALLLVSAATFAQSPLDTLAMRAIMVNQLFPQERVYLHLPKCKNSSSCDSSHTTAPSRRE